MTKPKRIELSPQEMESLLRRVETAVEEKDYEVIKGMADMIAYLSWAVEEKDISAKRLLRMLFGGSTEKTKKVLEALEQAKKESEATESPADRCEETQKGHGRNGASEYSGAEKVPVAHKEMKSGDPCPECKKGKVYRQSKPGVLVRLKGQAPLQATVYELEKYRCNLCGKVFTAKAPAGVGDQKYDESSRSMVALLKYGSGLPFNRLEKLQGSMGIPLPATTQWEIIEGMANRVYPVFNELKHQAAQGEVVHNDDTGVKILSLMKENEKAKAFEEDPSFRLGMFTSGIVSTFEEKKIALFFTGRNHAGENLAELLSKREAHRGAPIHMCDALSRNTPKAFQVLLANCLAHGRRQFVDVACNFPEQCRYVLEVLKEVYKNDAITKELKMSAEYRLEFHRLKSKPLMKKLHKWLHEQLKERKVEPNSGLGKAITYMLKHWKALTLFLREPNAPLDNNLCERALKKSILHRKNSLFFKTEHGAYIGDLFMSLIHTCNLNDVNPFHYLTELQKHSKEVFQNPQDWLPWNYEAVISPTKR